MNKRKFFRAVFDCCLLLPLCPTRWCINTKIAHNHIRLEKELLERTVTEYDLFFPLDQIQPASVVPLVRCSYIKGWICHYGSYLQPTLTKWIYEKTCNQDN